MRRMRILAGVLAAGIGCGGPTTSSQPIGEPPVAAPDPTAALWREPITMESFARRVLYTWTTDEQVTELRRTRVLLSREESPDHGASAFEKFVFALAGRGDPIAALLDTTGFAKSRFAWPAPWATRAGYEDEHYGEQLVRITLRDDAIVLALDQATQTFIAHDMRDRPVDVATVLAAPERIGAVYFVTPTYREYVVPNESMIASWSVGTDDITAELRLEASALEALARDRDPDRASYKAARAFYDVGYDFDVAKLTWLATHLRATPKPTAFESGARATFPGVGVRRPPPRVAKPHGTYLGTY